MKKLIFVLGFCVLSLFLSFNFVSADWLFYDNFTDRTLSKWNQTKPFGWYSEKVYAVYPNHTESLGYAGVMRARKNTGPNKTPVNSLKITKFGGKYGLVGGCSYYVNNRLTFKYRYGLFSEGDYFRVIMNYSLFGLNSSGIPYYTAQHSKVIFTTEGKTGNSGRLFKEVDILLPFENRFGDYYNHLNRNNNLILEFQCKVGTKKGSCQIDDVKLVGAELDRDCDF